MEQNRTDYLIQHVERHIFQNFFNLFNTSENFLSWMTRARVPIIALCSCL